MIETPLLLDSITDAGAGAFGRVVLCGSHGGMYPASIASLAGVRAVVFNDAGGGLDRAGVAGVLALADVGLAAAAVASRSCRIGSAKDTAARGVISVANAAAQQLGVTPGMSARQAGEILRGGAQPHGQLPEVPEARQIVVLPSGLRVQCLDSASLVTDADAGQIVITGSHGALIGGDPARALKARARVAVFNDAGFGIDNIGVTRLPALNACGVAAVSVSCDTARIGDARSALKTGMISAVNAVAQAAGAEADMLLSDWLNTLTKDA